MKLFFLAFIFLFTISSAFSQTKGKGSLGLEVGFPTGTFSEGGTSTGFGGSFRYEGVINHNLNWLANFGYLNFTASQNYYGTTISGSASFIPITAGVKYYPEESFNGFYFGGELGVAVINAKATVSGGGYSGSISGSENKFMFAPQLGYHFSGFDLTFRYNVISDANYLGIRAAVTF